MDLVDSHVHFWQPALLNYRWLDNVPELNKAFGVETFPANANAHHSIKLVVVEANTQSNSFNEVRWLIEQAKTTSLIGGIVAHAPLELGMSVMIILERLKEFQLVKGIRRSFLAETDDFCLNPRFLQGLNLLPRYRLSFDICIRSSQLSNVILMVKKCPEVQFILNHIGSPSFKVEHFASWQENISLLSSFENVTCKLSGIVTQAMHDPPSKRDYRPYINHLLQCFGPKRIMFGSDWPVLLQVSTYEQWYSLAGQLLYELSDHERTEIFSSNAQRVYRVQLTS